MQNHIKLLQNKARFRAFRINTPRPPGAVKAALVHGVQVYAILYTMKDHECLFLIE